MRPDRVYLRPMLDLGTLAGLLEHDHQLAAYCPRCHRWRAIDIGMRERGTGGLDSNRIGLSVASFTTFPAAPAT